MSRIIIIIAAILCSTALYAQQDQMRRGARFEQVEAEKIAFFTRYLELSSEEAKTFWPVYNEFQAGRNQLLREGQTLSRNFSENRHNMTGTEAREIADRYIKLQVRESELAVEYHNRFMKVLAPEKVMLFYQAENEFRMQLLRRIRGGGPGRGAGPPNRE